MTSHTQRPTAPYEPSQYLPPSEPQLLYPQPQPLYPRPQLPHPEPQLLPVVVAPEPEWVPAGAQLVAPEDVDAVTNDMVWDKTFLRVCGVFSGVFLILHFRY